MVMRARMACLPDSRDPRAETGTPRSVVRDPRTGGRVFVCTAQDTAPFNGTYCNKKGRESKGTRKFHHEGHEEEQADY